MTRRTDPGGVSIARDHSDKEEDSGLVVGSLSIFYRDLSSNAFVRISRLCTTMEYKVLLVLQIHLDYTKV